MKIPIILCAVLFAGMVSCKKDPVKDLSDDDSRIYITQKSPDVNFGNYKTYSIADSVLIVDGNGRRREPATNEAAYIAAFKEQMQARGFTYVERSAKPDLGLQISRIIRTNSGVFWQDYYDDWGSGYWGGGYGWGADPGWWSYPVYYQTTEGMLSFDLIDIKSAQTSNQLNIVWNGLIRGAGIYSGSSVASQVQQLFAQSAYLTNK